MEIIRFFDLMLLLFILLLPSELLVQVGAYECEYKSAHFKGPCSQRNKECYDCCQEEGFDRGSCKGFLLRHCMCTKSCESPGEDVPPPPPEEDVPPPPEEDVPPPPEEDAPLPPGEDVPLPPGSDSPIPY